MRRGRGVDGPVNDGWPVSAALQGGPRFPVEHLSKTSTKSGFSGPGGPQGDLEVEASRFAIADLTGLVDRRLCSVSIVSIGVLTSSEASVCHPRGRDRVSLCRSCEGRNRNLASERGIGNVLIQNQSRRKESVRTITVGLHRDPVAHMSGHVQLSKRRICLHDATRGIDSLPRA